MKHLDQFEKLIDSGVGFVFMHYAVEVPVGRAGVLMREAMGGYFETHWSVNPHWTADFKSLPKHPITRGIKPFTQKDEWYFHMRFQPEMKGVTPILSALPPVQSLTDRSEDSNRGSNPTVLAAVEAGEQQHVAWAYERPDGGRGFGFTGGHFHKNWQQDDFRKLVLNALVWTARREVPKGGVFSRTPTDIEMEANQDFPKPQSMK